MATQITSWPDALECQFNEHSEGCCVAAELAD
jgi:hypothetical protein